MTATEPTTYRCANHPNRETMVRCGKCEKPLCTDCMVMTPVGVRCRECANLRPIPTYDVGPLVVVRALVVGLVVALVLATLVRVTPLGPFAFFLMPFYGWLVSEAIARVSNEKRGPRLQIVAGVCIAAGLLVGAAAPIALIYGGGPVGAITQLPALLALGTLGRIFDFGFLFQLALALVFGVSRLR